ncbi:MAG: hypothetical protein UR26_C0002G0232 [candidate division TM6 bacterium GW2011_GWF2_32_72]|nr:MAG: hypothetical protein UR26_C0002G0232 [candidate division TM6 bacterium GW2011_GWF2_32_72]
MKKWLRLLVCLKIFFYLSASENLELNNSDDIRLSDLMTRAIIISSFYLCSTNIVKYFAAEDIEKKVCWLNSEGRTPLTEALALGDLEIVEILLNKKIINKSCYIDSFMESFVNNNDASEDLICDKTNVFWKNFTTMEQVFVANVLICMNESLDSNYKIKHYMDICLTEEDVNRFEKYILKFVPPSLKCAIQDEILKYKDLIDLRSFKEDRLFDRGEDEDSI